MSLYFAEGFNQWATGELDVDSLRSMSSPWQYFRCGTSPDRHTIQSGQGRFLRNALGIHGNRDSFDELIQLGILVPPYYRVGFWMKLPSHVIAVDDDDDDTTNSAFGLHNVDPLGQTAVNTTSIFWASSLRNIGQIGSGSTILPIPPIQLDVWHWMEVNVESTRVQIYMDSIFVGEVIGPIIPSTWMTFSNRYFLQTTIITGGGLGDSVLIDDIIVWTDDGIGLSQYPIGPRRIETKVPTSALVGDLGFIPNGPSNVSSLTPLYGGLTGGVGNSSPSTGGTSDTFRVAGPALNLGPDAVWNSTLITTAWAPRSIDGMVVNAIVRDPQSGSALMEVDATSPLAPLTRTTIVPTAPLPHDQPVHIHAVIEYTDVAPVVPSPTLYASANVSYRVVG